MRGCDAFVVFIVLTMVASGCGDEITEPMTPGFMVLTDRPAYTPSSIIQVSAINLSGKTVYLRSCSEDTQIERYDGKDWIQLPAWYDTCDGPTVPIPVDPGGFRGWPDFVISAHVWMGSGLYRIRTKAFSDEAFGDPLPEGMCISATFEIISY